MKKTFYFLVAIIIGVGLCPSMKKSTPQVHTIVKKIKNNSNWLKYKKVIFNFSFREINPEMKIANLNLPGKIGRFGVEGNIPKFARALRFRNITAAVESRYNLPPGIIFAMMVEESNGIDMLPNGLGDGGYGLCHMQPVVAKDFGLKIFENCKAMVCNGKDKRSCKINGHYANHALDLKKCIEKFNFDRKRVITCDDRLHPLKNLDAVGRLLSCYMDGPLLPDCGPFRTAICRYAGRYNYRAYWRDVKANMKLLEDKNFLKKVEVEVNRLSPKLTIGGKFSDFKEYIEYFEKQNVNYGLEEYKKLGKLPPQNSDVVLRTYRNF